MCRSSAMRTIACCTLAFAPNPFLLSLPILGIHICAGLCISGNPMPYGTNEHRLPKVCKLLAVIEKRSFFQSACSSPKTAKVPLVGGANWGPFAKSLDVIHDVPSSVSPKSCCTSTKCGLEVMACTGGVFAPCAYHALLLQSVHPGRPDFPPSRNGAFRRANPLATRSV